MPGPGQNNLHEEDKESFAPCCLSIDLEVSRQSGQIRALAGLRGDTAASVKFSGGDLNGALEGLDRLAADVRFVIGHNLIRFDLPQLAAVRPGLRLLSLPAVDTLWLNPLAFPRNPYHHLVKHYQEGQLQVERTNDPLLDAQLTLRVFGEQQQALKAMNASAPQLLLAWHWLCTQDGQVSGMDRFFVTIRRKLRPTDGVAQGAMADFLADKACLTASRNLVSQAAHHAWPLAYAMAWLSVAGGNSVMPPWVRHQFPEAGALVQRLRDVACTEPACTWCRERHDAKKELKRWFGFDAFRPEPAGEDGRPLQQSIVEAAMAGKHVLAILPTGTGKSLCYQVPALSRFDKTGALTVVISPLVALMEDQVRGLEGRGGAAAINGLLSMPERRDVLERLRLGDVGILLIAPEQLRSPSVRKALAQREIGAWVLDEAHCLSKWGHDFRPDYRYVGRFIRENAGKGPLPPVLCLTATAKPEVVAEIRDYFRHRLGVELKLFDGGAKRKNLDFYVSATTPGEKFGHVEQYLAQYLPKAERSGAIIYCSSRLRTEEIANFLREKGWEAAHFHAGLPPTSKKDVQGRFIAGDVRVICATNAFGMGIDKPDVRLVVHADIPGSLENYLQEAGRAGRDREPAICVLLYTDADTERQFGLSARSRLSQREIQAILKSLWNLDRRKKGAGKVVATSGEILREEEDGEFNRESGTDDTRVRTAVSWLEEAELLSRDENQVQVFPSSLRVPSVAEAAARLQRRGLEYEQQRPLLAIVGALVNADPDEGLSTDELMAIAGLSPDKLRKALYDLEALGIASNDTKLTAFVHAGIERSSRKLLEEAVALETALIGYFRELAHDLSPGESSVVHFRQACQKLKDEGIAGALPIRLGLILKGLAEDGRDEDGGVGSLSLRRLDADSMAVKLQREWGKLEKGARARHSAAGLLLEALLCALPVGGRKGVDLLAETTLGDLKAALDGDLLLKQGRRNGGDTSRLLDRALLWLHEMEIIRLNKGLTVFRSAMTLSLCGEKRGFRNADFEPLAVHYHGQIEQIHIMAEYAQRGLEAVADAVRLAVDYFALSHDEFMAKWLPGRQKDLERQTTPGSWKRIVECLAKADQQRIVTDERQKANVLVLAGPGSGKTRVLVHRIAWLLRVKRENPRSIAALAYNRHAAVEIRRRLKELIGDDARGVTVLTCDALAMRLTGASFADRGQRDADIDVELKMIRKEAAALLRGEGLLPEEADEQRSRLLAGFNWILVDEYQDIGPEQYELISALAGRRLADEDSRLNLFAVGDDDQNIYAFNGASVAFIRRFGEDYQAQAAYLTQNYRSSAHIIAAANALIGAAGERMKAAHPIRINRAREKDAPGGIWQKADPVAQGRVQVIHAGPDRLHQAQAVMTEYQRLASLAGEDWNWATCAVIARDWDDLEPLRAWCEYHGVPVQTAREELPVWSLRETGRLVTWLRTECKVVDSAAMRAWLVRQGAGPWWDLLAQALDEYELENGGLELPSAHFVEWLAEWSREARRSQRGLLLLTAHRAKGLEFDHVAVLDGAWERVDQQEDKDAPRRLYYVAMTRARHTLFLARLDAGRRLHPLLDKLKADAALLRREPVALPAPGPELNRRYVVANQGQIDLGHGGRHAPDAVLHRYIAALQPGSPLQLKEKGGRWLLLDGDGHEVGSMSSTWSRPAGVCLSAKVYALVRRSRAQTPEKYLDRVHADTDFWEVVLPELVFGPTPEPVP